MTKRYDDAELVRIGAAKGALLAGQPSTAWGEETEVEVRCVNTDGSYGGLYGEMTYGGDPSTRSDWYEIFRDYARHAGADGFGRLEDGSPWVEDSSRSSWPVDSNIVKIVAGEEILNFEDVWALITEIEDESEIPFVYQVTVTFVPLAFADDYATRDELLNTLATPSIQL